MKEKKKTSKLRATYQVSDSPVDHIRKQLPRGNGEWPGFDVVYHRLQRAAHEMADEPYIYLSDEHVGLMAIMGCGHEETMKAEMHRLMGRGYINLSNTSEDAEAIIREAEGETP